MAGRINWREFGAIVQLIGKECGVEVRLDPGSNEESVILQISQKIESDDRVYFLLHAISFDCCEKEELAEPVREAIEAAKSRAKQDMASWGSQA